MSASKRSELATYAALAVAAALALLLIWTRPPAGLRTTCGSGWGGRPRCLRGAGVPGRLGPRERPCASGIALACRGSTAAGPRGPPTDATAAARQAAAGGNSSPPATRLHPLPPTPPACSLSLNLEEPTDGVEVAVVEVAEAAGRLRAATLITGPEHQAALAQRQADEPAPAEQADEEPVEQAGEVPNDGPEPAEQLARGGPHATAAEAQPAAQQEPQQAGSEAVQPEPPQQPELQLAAPEEEQAQAEEVTAAQPEQQAQPAEAAQQAAPEQEGQGEAAGEGQEEGQQESEGEVEGPARPAKRGIDQFREFAAAVASCFMDWGDLRCLKQQERWVSHRGAAAGGCRERCRECRGGCWGCGGTVACSQVQPPAHPSCAAPHRSPRRLPG